MDRKSIIIKKMILHLNVVFIILYRPEVQKWREKCELTLKKGIRLR